VAVSAGGSLRSSPKTIGADRPPGTVAQMRFVLATLLALAALVLAACGGRKEQAPAFEEMVERSAAAMNAEVGDDGSVGFDLNAAVTLEGSGELAAISGKRISAEISGNASQQAAVMDIALNVGEQSLELGYRGTTEKGYLGFAGKWAETDPLERGADAALEHKPPTAEQITGELRELADAGLSAGEGRAQDGFYVYPVEIDAARLADYINEQGAALGQQVAPEAVAALTESIDAELGFYAETDLLAFAKLRIDADGETIAALSEASGEDPEGLESLQADLEFSLRDWNEPVEFSEPPAEQIVSEDELSQSLGFAFLGLLGGLAQTTGAPS